MIEERKSSGHLCHRLIAAGDLHHELVHPTKGFPHFATYSVRGRVPGSQLRLQNISTVEMFCNAGNHPVA